MQIISIFRITKFIMQVVYNCCILPDRLKLYEFLEFHLYHGIFMQERMSERVIRTLPAE